MLHKKIWISERKLLKLIEDCNIPKVSHDYWWGDTHMLSVYGDDYKVYFDFKDPSDKYPWGCNFGRRLLQLTWDRKNIDIKRILPVHILVDWSDGTGPEFTEAQNALIQHFGKKFI